MLTATVQLQTRFYRMRAYTAAALAWLGFVPVAMLIPVAAVRVEGGRWQTFTGRNTPGFARLLREIEAG